MNCRPQASPAALVDGLHALPLRAPHLSPAPIIPHAQRHRAAALERLSHRARQSVLATAAAEPTPGDALAPASAKEAVEAGLLQFEAGDPQAALDMFLRAQRLGPDEEEARAACYNAACALAKLRRWQEAADAVVAAVNEHNLKLSVAMGDPDLAPLRETREWASALDRAAGGVTNDAFIRLRTEARAPFRLARLILVGALSAGALLGLLIGVAQLAAAAGGGEGAPDLTATLRNLGINAGALAALLFLLRRDLDSQRRDQEAVEREEALAQLQVAVGPSRVLQLAAFRGVSRPVIVAGSKKQVSRAVAAARPFYPELRDRGVCVVPVVISAGAEEEAGDDEEEDAKAQFVEVRRWDRDDPATKLRKLKAEFGGGGGGGGGDGAVIATAGSAAGAPQANQSGKGFGGGSPDRRTAAPPAAAASRDSQWELQPADASEWAAWLRSQVKAGGGMGKGAYVQVQLDGSVRASGVGAPNWKQLVGDLPALDDVRTKFGDGAGMG